MMWRFFYSRFSADQTLFSKNKLVRIPTISSTTQVAHTKYSQISQKIIVERIWKLATKNVGIVIFLNSKFNLLVVFGKYVLQKTKTK